MAFRAATRAVARRLGLTGWVKNERDGSVLLEAQGPADAVGKLLAWCNEGPPTAEVIGVDVGDVEPVDGEHLFDVRY